MRILLFAALLLGLPLLSATPVPADRLEERFTPPAGFQRGHAASGTFAAYLRKLPLRAAGTPVLLHDGRTNYRQDVHAAVLDVSVGNRDLQQCADAVMRLRAEHLFAAGRYADIHFNFTNGFRAEFTRWANGERIEVRGNGCRWNGAGRKGWTRENLMSFLETVFTYAGTLSLSKELKSATGAIEAGDVFIQGGSPGHAVMVLDVARDASGRTAFLLAQSYMPAQDIHVLARPDGQGAWYMSSEGDHLVTPEWTFRWEDRKRW